MLDRNRLVNIGGDRYVRASDIKSVKPMESGSAIKVDERVVTSDKKPSEIAQQVNGHDK